MGGQVWESANNKMNKIPVVFSEDFGQRVITEGVNLVNPSRDKFKMEVDSLD
jgi:hypothetical protein